jgi:type III restriction enzyme
MDAVVEVYVYAKLPRSFQIPTSVGDYAPDWAIAFSKAAIKYVFFVAETKGTMDTRQLDTVEQSKFEYAKKLFNEMSTEDVHYYHVATYDQLLSLVLNLE